MKTTGCTPGTILIATWHLPWEKRDTSVTTVTELFTNMSFNSLLPPQQKSHPVIQIYVISPEICNLPKFLYVNFVCSSFTDLVILFVARQFSVITRTPLPTSLIQVFTRKLECCNLRQPAQLAYLYVLGVYFSGNSASQNNYSLNSPLELLPFGYFVSLKDSLRFS